MIEEFFKNPTGWLLAVILAFLVEELLRGIFFSKNKSLPEKLVEKITQDSSNTASVSNVINVSMPIESSGDTSSIPRSKPSQPDLQGLKGRTHILVIDDEEFGQIENVKGMGWTNIRTIEDLNDIDSSDAVWADIIFVDVQGVGKMYATKAGGVELLRALRNRYGKKKWLILYSANRRYGMEIFESGADAYLPKNARPIEIESKILEGAEALGL
jgi:hypothetical protein